MPTTAQGANALALDALAPLERLLDRIADGAIMPAVEAEQANAGKKRNLRERLVFFFAKMRIRFIFHQNSSICSVHRCGRVARARRCCRR